MDNDGFVSNGELFQVLKMMVGNNLKDSQLQQIVDKTILMYDKVSLVAIIERRWRLQCQIYLLQEDKNKINFEEFCCVVGNMDIHEKMVLQV